MTLNTPKQKLLLLLALTAVFGTAVIAFLINSSQNEKSKHSAELAERYKILLEAKSEGKDVVVYKPSEQIGPLHDATHPTIGPLRTMVAATIDHENKRLFLKEQNNNVKINQIIIFYSPNRTYLGSGTITKVLHSISQTVASYQFNEATTETSSPSDFHTLADILISESSALKRIPIKAIWQEDGKHFIYVAKAQKNQENKTSSHIEGTRLSAPIKKQRIQIGLQDQTYIEAPTNLLLDDLVLTSPNETLQDGDEITLLVSNSRLRLPTISNIRLNQAKEQTFQDIEAWKKLGENCSTASTTVPLEQEEDSSTEKQEPAKTNTEN